MPHSAANKTVNASVMFVVISEVRDVVTERKTLYVWPLRSHMSME